MAKILQIGYSVSLLVPDSCLADLVTLLGQCKEVKGNHSNGVGQLQGVEFDIKNVHPDLGRELSEREKQLEKEAADKNSQWYKEYTKANELEKQVACLKSQVNDLIEKGISGAVFGKADAADKGDTKSDAIDDEIAF